MASVEQNLNSAPGRECEVFVYKIPTSVTIEELSSMFEKYGDVFTLRLVTKTSSRGNNYAFVRFTEKTAVTDAVLRWNGYEIRKGMRISVCKSVENKRLTLCSIPKYLHSIDIYYAVSVLTPGLQEVYIHTPRNNRGINSGLAVLMYSTRTYASIAKKILTGARNKVWKRPFYVDWYVPGLQWEDYQSLDACLGGIELTAGFVHGCGAEFEWNLVPYFKHNGLGCGSISFREYRELIYARFQERG